MRLTNVHKMTTVFCLLFVVIFSTAQENQSFYFAEAPLEDAEALETFPSALVGKYDGPDSTTRLIITPDAVKSLSYLLFTTTTDKVDSREDIYLKDGEIYGLSSQSFPYTLANDTIYFFYPNETTIFSLENGTLKKGSQTFWYMCMEEANGYYTVLMLELVNEKLSMKPFDHFEVWDELQTIETLKNKKVKGERAYVAYLGFGDIDNLEAGFVEGTNYVKQK